MKNYYLRAAWISPNVFLYLVMIGVFLFLFRNAEGLQEINALGIWIFFLLLLFIVNFWGSNKIWSWIKEGKM